MAILILSNGLLMLITQANSSTFGQGDPFIIDLPPYSLSGDLDASLGKVATFFLPSESPVPQALALRSDSEAGLLTTQSTMSGPEFHQETEDLPLTNSWRLIAKSYVTENSPSVSIGRYLNLLA